MLQPNPIPASMRTLLTLAWPIVVSRASQVVVGVCDALMVAGLGQAALAATTTGALNSFSVLILPMGVVFIVSSFSSQLFGRKDLTGARRYGYYGLAVALFTQLVALLGLPLIGPILGVLPYEPEVRGLMHGYLSIRFLSAGAVVGMEALANYYGGLGNTRLPMVANVTAMVVNVIGNWLLIGGNLGFPALGVSGAAWASAVATWMAFTGLLGRFLLDGRTTGRTLPTLRMHELVRMLRFGIPSGFNWFFEFFAFIVFVNVVVAGLGTTALAGMMAVMQINSVSFMPAFGLASAGAILVGQAIGADRKGEVPRIVRLTFTASGTWQTAVGLCYLLFPGAIFALFVQDANPATAADLLEVGVRILMLSAAWQLFDSAATVLAEALRAAGDTTFTLWARVVIAWGIFTPGAYLTVQHLGWGDRGAVFWLVFYLALLALVLFVRFRRGAWRRIQLTEPELGI